MAEPSLKKPMFTPKTFDFAAPGVASKKSTWGIQEEIEEDGSPIYESMGSSKMMKYASPAYQKNVVPEIIQLKCEQQKVQEIYIPKGMLLKQQLKARINKKKQVLNECVIAEAPRLTNEECLNKLESLRVPKNPHFMSIRGVRPVFRPITGAGNKAVDCQLMTFHTSSEP